MKTTALIATLSILFALNVNASEYTFKEEAPAKDIPFDTKEVFDSIMEKQELASFEYDEEDNVNDIPFNTETIFLQSKYNMAITSVFSFPEESYEDDIPFNTESMVHQYKRATQELISHYCHR